LPEPIGAPFYKTTFLEMADIGEADMRAITFEILKKVNNPRHNEAAVDELQLFITK
jgi:hypothetical protein